MIMMSEFTIVGLFEVFAILLTLISLITLFFLKAKSRIKSLRTQLSQLKKTTLFLLDKVNESSKKYPDYLQLELQDTAEHFEKFSPGEALSYYGIDQSAPSRAVALRHRFLSSEQQADDASDEWERWELLITNMASIIESINPKQVTEDEQAQDTPLTSNVLSESWGELIDATKYFIEEGTLEAENNFVNLLQVLNNELGYAEFEPPARKTQMQKQMAQHNSGVDLTKLKESSEQQTQLIASLLSQRNAAESEVTIKAEELLKLQRFLKESDVCTRLLEDEISALHSEANALHKKLDSTNSLQNTIDKLEEDLGEMTICIETLETENDQLRQTH